jgi:uncharacterized protein (DUF362 family)
MKIDLNRRRFLHLMTYGLGSLLLARFLAACQGMPGAAASETPNAPTSRTPVPPTGTPSPTPVPPTPVTSMPGNTAVTVSPSETATAEEPADLAVAHGGDDPEALVRSAIGALGGIGRFVPSGAMVVIKPNICTADRSYEYAATTNPWVVGALVKLCREAGAGRVVVLEYPFYHSSVEAYADSGIQEQVEAAGGEMLVTSKGYVDSNGVYNWYDYGKWISVSLPNAKRLKSFEIIDEVKHADVLINVPIAKHHDLTRLTLGMKNLMGVVHNRPAVHSYIADKLTDLALFLRPALTVVDAVRILTANGPRGGNLNDVKKMDTVIASPDIVAADSFATSLFGLMPADIGYIVKGAEAGLGTKDLSTIRIRDIPLGG